MTWPDPKDFAPDWERYYVGAWSLPSDRPDLPDLMLDWAKWYGTCASRIRDERDNRGWTQEYLAKKADVDPKTLIKIEKGHGWPALRMLIAVMSALDLKPPGRPRM